MFRRVSAFATAFALFLCAFGAAMPAAAQSTLCQNPNASCGKLISPKCQRLGAGSEDVGCEGQFTQYRECLRSVVEQCSSAPTPTSGDACSTAEAEKLWAEAKADNDCFGYEAFAQACPKNRYAIFAKNRMRRLKCASPARAAAPEPADSEPAGAPAPPARPAASRPAAKPQPAALKPGDTFRDCPVCPEMVEIPGGRFTMGSPSSEPGRDDDEGPQRQVRVGAFALGKYEVTFSEWDACVAEGGCSHRPKDAWGRGRQPVMRVSWNDAQDYVRWLNGKVGSDVYRLPSEAEWEYAARAGSTTPFWWGASITPRQANYDGTSSYNGSPKGAYRERTVAVGSFSANPFGVHDVHGNV